MAALVQRGQSSRRHGFYIVSAFRNFKCDKTLTTIIFHQKQYWMLSRPGCRLANGGYSGLRLIYESTVDFKDHIALANALLGCRRVRRHLRNHDTFAVSIRHQCQTKLLIFSRPVIVLRFDRRQLVARHCADGHLDLAFFSATENSHLDSCSGFQPGHFARQFLGTFDHGTVHFQNGISGTQTRLVGRRALGNGGNQCACRLVETNAGGNVFGNRLNLNAKPAAGHVAVVLEVGND